MNKRKIPPSQRPHRVRTPEGRLFRDAMRLPEPSDPTSTWDLDQLRLLGTPRAVWTVGGTRYPVLELIVHWDDHLDFDRAVCAAGLKSFIRPAMESDRPDRAPSDLAVDEHEYVLVREVTPSMRIRIGLITKARPA